MGILVSWLSAKLPDYSPSVSLLSDPSDPPEPPDPMYTQTVLSPISEIHPTPSPSPPIIETDVAQPTCSPPALSPSPPSSPPPAPASHSLRITIPDPDEPEKEADAFNAVPEPALDLCFDDEGLSSLDKMYLFSRSNISFQRAYIARSIHSFLPHITPSEAVEYAIPLMGSLAMDEDESVKEALVEDLSSTIWWFLSNCQIVEDELAEDASAHDPPLLSVQAFTPLLGALLLSPNSLVGAPARYIVVNLLNHLRQANEKEENSEHFGPEERRLFENELIHQVVIGMGHLDVLNGPAESQLTGVSSSDFSDTDLQVFGTELTTTDSAHQQESPSTRLPAESEQLNSSFATSTASQSSQADPSDPFSDLPLGPLTLPLLPGQSPLPPISAQQTSTPHFPAQNGNYTKMEEDVSIPGVSQPSNANHAVVVDIASPNHDSTPNGALVWSESEQPEDFHDASCDDEGAVGRLASMSLMAAVTANNPLSPETRDAFVAEVERVSHDPVYWVRREATFALGALTKVVPEEIVIGSLLPLFESFCRDPVWHVRQSVLFSLPAVLSRLPSSQRRIQTLKTIMTLSVDPSATVRSGVFEVLGEVIHTFYGDERGPPDEVIRLFIGEEGRDWYPQGHNEHRPVDHFQSSYLWRSFIEDHQSCDSLVDFYSLPSGVVSPDASFPDPAQTLIRAFNFPAVALTLGQSRWGEIRGLYMHLTRERAPKVRRTLAASIGEIAKIIGPANARADLMDVWWKFARGGDSIVRLKVFECLEVFLQALEPPDRERIALSLDDIWTAQIRNWRERETLVKALGNLAELLSSSANNLGALIRKAFEDPTAAVRDAAISSCVRIRQVLADNPDRLRLLHEEVQCLAYAESFRRRVTYIRYQRALALSDEQFDAVTDDDFWRILTVLASDSIADVRVGVARLLGTIYVKSVHKHHLIQSRIFDIAQILSLDPSYDVRSFTIPILSHDEEAAWFPTSPRSSIFSQPPPTHLVQSPTDGVEKLQVADRSDMDLDDNAQCSGNGSATLAVEIDAHEEQLAVKPSPNSKACSGFRTVREQENGHRTDEVVSDCHVLQQETAAFQPVRV